ncbi:MAG: peptide deformylase [Betaproteobacteria bacterium]|nr:peptide deformylase [Betaproteobacteria bacterium]
MIREVLRMGDPRLLRQAQTLARCDSPELAALVRDMFDTMLHLDGAGLAAPQIGENVRVVIFGFEHNSRYPDAEPVPRTVLINPFWEPLAGGQEDAWEGCLSVPGMRGLVPRHRSIRYGGIDAQGCPIERQARGFHARVVQHECDHLDGVLYPMRMRDMSRFGFADVLFPDGLPTPQD